MKNFYKVSNTIENGPRMDRKRTVVGPMKDRQKSRISPINHRLWTVIAPMLFVAFGLFGVNEEMWGLDPYQTLTDFNGSTTFSGKGKSGTGLQQLSGTTFSATQNRVTFTIGNLNSFDNPCLVYGNIGYPGSNSSTFGWSAETNYDVKVTSVSIGLRGYEAATTLTPAYGQFTSEGTTPGTKVDCRTNSVGGNGASTVSISNNSGLASTATLSMSTTSDRPYTWAVFGNVYANNAQFAITTVTYTYKVTHKKFQYGFSAVLGGVNNESYGSATASGGGTVYNEFTETTASKQVTFTATPTNTTTYKFVGWYSDAEFKNQVSTANPYTPTLYNGVAGKVETLTLYAKFDVKGTPLVTCNIADEYNIGHEPIDLQTLWTREGNGSITYSKVSFTPSGTNNTGATTPALSEGHIVSLGQAGTLKLQMDIEADGDDYLARTVTKEITINKYVPTFTWYCDDNTVYYNREIENFCTSDQSTTSITRSSSVENVASLSGTTLSVYNITGTTRVTMTQAENYYWAGHSEYRDITPVNANNHLEFTIDADNKDGIVIGNTSNVSWNTNGYKFGTNSWGVGGKPDDNIVIAFTGIPDKITFTKKCDKWGLNLPVDGDCLFEVYESATNGNWGNAIWSYNKQEESRDVTDVPQLQPTTRYIKLRYNGTVYGRFNNIHITERQYFRRQGENTTLDFATNLKNHVPEVQSFVVEHANAGYQTSVTAPEHYLVSKDNVNFASEVVYSTNETAVTGGDKMGTFTVYVKYLADAEGTHAGNVVVHNNLRDDFNVPVTGTTQGKLSTTLHYIGASAYNADTTNLVATDLFEVHDPNGAKVEGAVITLTTGTSTSVKLATDNKSIAELCGNSNEGTTGNVVASYAGDNTTYEAATNNGLSQNFTINRLKDEVSFDSGYESMVVGEEIDLTEWATSCTSGSDISVISVYSEYIVIEDGKVKAVKKGNGRLRADSEGNCVYNSGRTFMDITVRNPEDPCGSAVLYKSGTIKCGATAKTSSSPEVIIIPDKPLDKLTFKVWKYDWYATQEANVEILDNNDNVLPNGSFSYGVGSLGTSEPENPNIEIDMTAFSGAKKLKIYGSGTINKYIKDVRISQRSYLTASTSSVTMSTVKACETAEGQITVSYSDLSRIQLEQTNSGFTYEVWDGETKLDGFSNDCKSFGTYTIKFFYTPQAKGPYSNIVTLSASGKEQVITLNGTANAPDRTIVWDIQTGNTISATQSVDLTAYAETSCQSPAGSVYYTASPADAVTIDPIDGNHITFKKAATVTVTAHTTNSDDYNNAPTVDKVWTVSEVGTQMRTLPTITSTITCGDNSSVVTYDNNSWVAEDVLNHEEVEGAINYVGPASFTTAGEQNLTFNFTPNNLDTYKAHQFTVPVTVQQMASVATPVAANITYGHRVNESVLTSGEGSTTPGTWSWKVEEANTQILDAREEAYTGLNVIFTPENSNYATIETTVSLKVVKADPEATVSNVGITYGATASSVTLSGTGDGEWSWDDSRATQTLAAGVYNDMAVKFTPTDGDNYNELSTTITLTVSKADPVATANAVEITYGTLASSVTLSGAGVEGTWSWTDTRQDDVLAAGSFTMNVHFKPTDLTNYNEKDATVALTVKKATTTLSWTSNPTDLAYNATDAVYTATSASDGAITYSIISGGSYAHIDASTGALTIDVPGNTITIQAEQAEGTNYSAPTTITVEVTIAAAPVVPTTYTYTGDGNWTDDSKWSTNDMPNDPVEVVINGNVIISTEVTVLSLTVKDGGSVTLTETGKLTIGDNDSENLSAYGNLFVQNGGQVILGEGKLYIKDFTLEASLNGLDELSVSKSAKSGQVTNAQQLVRNGNAYFDLTFDPSGKISYGWYNFTVPFAVDINSGISRIHTTDNRVMVSGTDFIVMEADEVNRANGGKGWRVLNSGTLQPGKLYTITFNYQPTFDQNDFRFAWNHEGSILNGESYTAQCEPGSVEELRGWNGLGNGMLRHGYLVNNYKMQAYNHQTNTYELVVTNNTFAIGSAFFIQVGDAGAVNWTTVVDVNRPLYAPKREAEEVDEFLLSLRGEGSNTADYMYFSASEDATEAYRIGHDLLKMGTPTQATVAQIWATKGGKALCDVEAMLVNDEATTPLNLYAPNAGQYTLAVEEMPEDANLYLTYNGNIIWDLTTSPYVLDLTKGTTTGYALRIVAANAPQITTGVDDIQGGEAQVHKVIIDNKMYIITPEGAIFDAIGKKVQ